MIACSFEQCAKLLNLSSTFGGCFCGVSIDTRSIQPGNLFVALKGERVDGHDFVAEAQRKGASAALVSEPVATSLPCFVVPDVILAMGRLAAYWRDQFTLPIIGLTGSNGKTTTKNMIAAILLAASDHQEDLRLATIGNWNNQISLPLNVCRLNSQHRYAVFEMGMDHFGEISALTNIVHPTVAMITNAYPSHLAGVGGTLEGVAKAKGEIFEGLSETGTAVLNADSPFFDYWKKLVGHRRLLTFGIERASDVRADSLRLTPKNAEFVISTFQGDITIYLSLLGRHNVMNALAAATACLAIGIDLQSIKIGLENVRSESQRLQVKFSPEGACILDDSYNANPASLKAAIDVLVMREGKKILALGDMKELGETERTLHYEMGLYAKKVGVDFLYAVGDLTEEAIQGFGEGAIFFPSKAALIDQLKPQLNAQANVLVKGSHFSMHMEEVVEGLLK